MAGRLEVLLLGGVEVHDDGAPVNVAGAKLKAIVALLALGAPHPVSDDRLIEELWGDDQPANPTNALQGQVSHLRRVLGRDGVERRGPGYVLAIGPDDVDTIRLERAVRAGREAASAEDHHTAIASYETALALVRGRPLDDLAEFRFAQRVISRLDELIVSAHEGLADAMLASGRHGEVVASMTGLVQTHPLRERFHAQLILALYRSGRQAEALRAYQDARNTLVEEFGVDPGPELQALEQSVLNQDPALAVPAARDRRRPATPHTAHDGWHRTVAVGRDRELALLRDELAGALSGQVRVVLLGGEPGIGETRLAEEVTALATARNVPVVWGRSYDGRGAPAHWPWIQVVNGLLARVDEDVMRRALASDAVELAQIVPEVKELVPDLPSPAPMDPASAQFRLFRAFIGFMKRLTSAQPLMIVLDDIHWADAPSLELLTTLANELWDTPLLIVGTYRNLDPAIGGPLAAALVELSRRSSARRIDVHGLDRDDLAAMHAASGATASDDVVSTVHRRTQGNPFFVSELIHVLPGGSASDADAAGRAVPIGVKGVIRQRIARLPDDTRATITVAATLGQEFDLAVLAATIGANGATLLDHLDPAIEAGVLVDNVEGVKRYRFSHGLINETIYDDLGVGQRARTHLRIAEALEAHHGDTEGAHLFAIAEHRFLAVPAAAADAGIDAALRAAQWAQTHVAHHHAIEQLRAALELVAGMPEGRHRAVRELEVQDQLCQLLIAATSYTDRDFGAVCTRIRELCDQIGDRDLLVPAMWRLAIHHMMSGQFEDGISVGDQLLDLAGSDETASARLAGHIAALALVRLPRGESALAASHFREAVAMCDAGHDAALMRSVTEEPTVFVRVFSAINRWSQGDLVGAEREAQEATDVALRTGRHTWATMVSYWGHSTVAMLLREPARSVELCNEGIELAIAGGYGLGVPYMMANRGWATAMLGDVERGEAELLEGVAIAESFGAVYMRPVFSAMHADVCLVGGRHDEALAAIESGFRAAEATGECWFDAELHRLRGEALLGKEEDKADALDAFARAITIAKVQGANALVDRATASLAAAGGRST